MNPQDAVFHREVELLGVTMGLAERLHVADRFQKVLRGDPDIMPAQQGGADIDVRYRLGGDLQLPKEAPFRYAVPVFLSVHVRPCGLPGRLAASLSEFLTLKFCLPGEGGDWMASCENTDFTGQATKPDLSCKTISSSSRLA